MIEKATSIALPTVLLLGSQYATQGADAGPIFGSWCLLACVPLVEAPPLLALCIAACAAAGIAPTP